MVDSCKIKLKKKSRTLSYYKREELGHSNNQSNQIKHMRSWVLEAWEFIHNPLSSEELHCSVFSLHGLSPRLGLDVLPTHCCPWHLSHEWLTYPKHQGFLLKLGFPFTSSLFWALFMHSNPSHKINP